MRTYWAFLILLATLLLGLFALAQWLQIPLLTNPDPILSRGGPTAALVGFGLLVGDVVLPVPSSLVMIAHGAMFGVFRGTLLSWLGGVGAAAFGFALGRWGSRWRARFMPLEEMRRADGFLGRWGELAVVVTRAVPILAESVAIVAGTSTLTWRRFLTASLAGSFPGALLYALTGATAARLDNTILVFLLVLLVAGLFYMIGRALRRGGARDSRASVA